jgi:hypothetical protein
MDPTGPTRDFGETLAFAALEGYKGNMRLEAFERGRLSECLATTWKRERASIVTKADRGETEFQFEFIVHNQRFSPTTEDIIDALPFELWQMRNNAERGYTVRVTETDHNKFRINLGVSKRAHQLIDAYQATQEVDDPPPKRRKGRVKKEAVPSTGGR